LTAQRGPGGFRYLWAKNGPVWFVEPTPEREADLRRLLAESLRRVDPRLVFVRLHAMHEAPDLRPLLQGITYDRTVIVDLDRSPEEIFAAMKQQGRRAIRKALKDESRSEEHTSELQSRENLVCRLLLEKKKRNE